MWVELAVVGSVGESVAYLSIPPSGSLSGAGTGSDEPFAK